MRSVGYAVVLGPFFQFGKCRYNQRRKEFFLVADNADLLDKGGSLDTTFNVLRRNIFPAGRDNDIFNTSRDLQAAVTIDYAYVAGIASGLRVVDVSDPARPSEVGFQDTPGVAWSVGESVGVALGSVAVAVGTVRVALGSTGTAVSVARGVAVKAPL